MKNLKENIIDNIKPIKAKKTANVFDAIIKDSEIQKRIENEKDNNIEQNLDINKKTIVEETDNKEIKLDIINVPELKNIHTNEETKVKEETLIQTQETENSKQDLELIKSSELNLNKSEYEKYKPKPAELYSDEEKEKLKRMYEDALKLRESCVKKMCFQLEPSLVDEFREICKEQKIPQTAIIRKAIVDFINVYKI